MASRFGLFWLLAPVQYGQYVSDYPSPSKKKKNTIPNSYSSSCDIEMFVVMQRRQPKMANNGLSSPYSFDRHSTKQKKVCNPILSNLSIYINIMPVTLQLYATCQTHRNQHSIHYC